MTEHVIISDTKATTVDHDLQREILGQYGISVTSTITRTEEGVLDVLDGASGIIVDAGVPITNRVIESNPSLTVVGRAGIGVDNVDLEAAAENDVTVVHNPTYCIDEVATHALSLLLACVRKLPVYDRQSRNGEWEWSTGQPIQRLSESKIGFLGFGKIPRRLATMIQGFGCTLLATDPYLASNIVRTHNVEQVSFEELLSSVDILSVHVPLTEETHRMIDADAFDLISDEAILVNTARGPIVDTQALVDALSEERIGFAGLDVTDPEPLPTDHSLRTLDNVILTPHVAWYSKSSREQLSIELAHDVGHVLTGESPQYEVSLDVK